MQHCFNLCLPPPPRFTGQATMISAREKDRFLASLISQNEARGGQGLGCGRPGGSLRGSGLRGAPAGPRKSVSGDR